MTSQFSRVLSSRINSSPAAFMRKTDFTSEEHALLAAVHAHPQDDLPRLVYADWLEERGDLPDTELAEMIRLGVEAGRTGTPFQLVPRMKEIDLRVRRRYVSPLPKRLNFSHWERGLPMVGATVDIGDSNYQEILGSIDPHRHALCSFALGLRHSSTSGLRGMLSHPVMSQVHRLWIIPSRRMMVEDIRLLAEMPRISKIHFFFYKCPVRTEIGDAIMSLLAPLFPIGWWEIGHQYHIVSNEPRTWPERFKS